MNFSVTLERQLFSPLFSIVKLWKWILSFQGIWSLSHPNQIDILCCNDFSRLVAKKVLIATWLYIKHFFFEFVVKSSRVLHIQSWYIASFLNSNKTIYSYHICPCWDPNTFWMYYNSRKGFKLHESWHTME